MAEQDTPRTTVIYNGECPICSREIESYRKYCESNDIPIRFAGLSEADLSRWGLTRDQAARRLYVVDAGRRLDGVAAFLALWRRMPRFRPLARVVALPGIRQAAELLYDRVLAPALYALHRRRVRRRRQAAGA